MINRNKPSFDMPRYISDRDAEQVAAKIAKIRKRAKRRAIVDKIVTRTLYVTFVLLGLVGVYATIEIASFLWGAM